ncbi:hypothetical protein KIW84_023674 [Lathyrus oleraceus]|uniref:Calcineurin B-like protein n=1 Tax=Pisum sativum TaxID=3888 RepID=A0A9D5BBH0_PEA|nr:hypothetical protein KIW84_023674 [Pisum sativum]
MLQNSQATMIQPRVEYFDFERQRNIRLRCEERSKFFAPLLQRRDLMQKTSLEDPKAIVEKIVFSISKIKSILGVLLKKEEERVNNVVINNELINEEVFYLALSETSKEDNLFTDGVLDLVDTKCKGILGFKDFARVLSIFHPNAPIAKKIEFPPKCSVAVKQQFRNVY